MSGDGVRLRGGTPDDTESILELVRVSLGEGEIPRELSFWRWKHHENPFGASPVLLAEAEGQLVGLRVFMRWRWSASGEPVRAVRAVDTATHPQWRGRGVFSKLTRALLEEMRADGVHFVFNTPNEKSRPGYLKMGWQQVGRTSPWIRPLRPHRIVRALAAGPAVEGDTRRDDESAGPVSGFLPAGEVCVLPQFASLVEAVWRDRQRDRRLSTHLSPAYFRWRYGEIPGIDYQAEYEGGGGSAAAVIFRRKGRGRAVEARICEILCSGDRGPRIARDLLHRLRRECEADYLSAMAASRTPERRTLIRCGFLPAARMGPILTVRPLNPVAGVDPLKSRDWRYSAGEMELF